MVELNESLENEILQVLTSFGARGCTFTMLYQRTTLFEDETELSRTLHTVLTSGAVVKLGKSYYTKESYDSIRSAQPKVDDTKIVAEIRSLIGDQDEQEIPEKSQKVKVVKVSRKVASEQLEEKPQQSEAEASAVLAPRIPSGNLRRSRPSCSIAMALYKFRHKTHYLSRDELLEIIGDPTIKPIAFYTSINRLIRDGYVISTDSNGKRFKWSGKFFYPFAVAKPEDSSMIKYDPQAYDDLKNSVINPVSQKQEKKILENNNVDTQELSDRNIMLRLIDLEIKAAESVVESLKRIRTTFENCKE